MDCPALSKVHKCIVCGEPSTQRCSGCTVPTAWYCSQEDQKFHWIYHKFECKPSSVTTADHLALAVYENEFPQDQKTRDDYGFSAALSKENCVNLLGLYIGLIKVLHVKPKTIQRWRQNGTLVQGIKSTFSTVPEKRQGGYYPWFLENEHLLDGSTHPRPDLLDKHFAPGFRYVGLSTSSKEVRDSTLASWPPRKKECGIFCNTILVGFSPNPIEKVWVTFGFCACPNKDSETWLADMYREVQKKTSFEKLYDAYDRSRLLSLFGSKFFREAPLPIPHLVDVLSDSPDVRKSVWYLKQFVVANTAHLLIPAVRVDYGFINCRNKAETEELRDVYKQVFERRDADPFQLHEACITGKLFEYIGGLIKLKGSSRRLFGNPYPLAEY